MIKTIQKLITWFIGLFRRSKITSASSKRKADKRDKYGRKCTTLWNSSVRGTYTVRRPYIKVGRNELCPCGSGLKHKKCHGVNV